MTIDLLQQLEQKVTNAVELIEFLRLQVEELEEENAALKTEHNKWRHDLATLIKQFDRIEVPSTSPAQRPRIQVSQRVHVQEEDYIA